MIYLLVSFLVSPYVLHSKGFITISVIYKAMCLSKKKNMTSFLSYGMADMEFYFNYIPIQLDIHCKN